VLWERKTFIVGWRSLDQIIAMDPMKGRLPGLQRAVH
jgi:hypothetical protein